MDDLERYRPLPTSNRPLMGLTVLVVEDSRFACEALRLLCLHSGARIRRADCLRSARRHLQVYRPSVVIADLGLPDGSGCELIADLASAPGRVAVILGLSGDDGAEGAAMTAGADGFIAKPITSLATFQEAVLRHLPPERQPFGPRVVPHEEIVPDRIAFQDDMAHLSLVLKEGPEEASLDYITQFLSGVARSASDGDLVEAADALADARRTGRAIRADLARVTGLVEDRLSRRIAM